MSRPSRRADQEVPRLTPEQLREFEARKAAIPASEDPEDVLTPEEAAAIAEAKAKGEYYSLDEFLGLLDQHIEETCKH